VVGDLDELFAGHAEISCEIGTDLGIVGCRRSKEKTANDVYIITQSPKLGYDNVAK
jgi:hypothetical protein